MAKSVIPYNIKEPSIKWAAGSQEISRLNRNFHVKRIKLKLTLQVKGNLSATATLLDETNLFKAIETYTVRCNGNINIRQSRGENIVLDNLLDSGRVGNNNLAGFTISGGETKTLYQYAYIDLAYPNTPRPFDTILGANNYTDFDLMVNFADAGVLSAKMGSGESEISIESGTLEIVTERVQNFIRNKGEESWYYNQTFKRTNITADNSAFKEELDVNREYTGVMLVCEKAGMRTNEVLKNIRLRVNGSIILFDAPAADIQAQNMIDYKIQKDSNMVGVYYIDFLPRKKLIDKINTVQQQTINGVTVKGFNTFDFELEIVGADDTTFVNVYQRFVSKTGIVENTTIDV